MTESDQQIALITGAGRGIGRAAAEALAARGACVAACDITPVNLDITLANILAAGGRAKDYICDIGKLMPVQTMIDQVLADWGRIDVLINCSAVRPRAAILVMDEWDLRRTVEVNLVGTFFLLQQVGRVMRDAGGGVIINLAAAPEQEQTLEESAYMASMAGLLALTQQAAQELSQYGIRVHAVQSREIGWAQAAQVDPQVVTQIVSLCSRCAGKAHGGG